MKIYEQKQKYFKLNIVSVSSGHIWDFAFIYIRVIKNASKCRRLKCTFLGKHLIILSHIA